MAYIPDELFFYRASSMASMARFYSGLYGHFDWMRLSRMAQALGLDTGKPLRAFSKGMQKQAAFVLAVSLRPDVLVLDEPIDGLDPVMRRQLWSLILQDVAERSTTVVVSSHNLRELEDVCDHVGIARERRAAARAARSARKQQRPDAHADPAKQPGGGRRDARPMQAGVFRGRSAFAGGAFHL